MQAVKGTVLSVDPAGVATVQAFDGPKQATILHGAPQIGEIVLLLQTDDGDWYVQGSIGGGGVPVGVMFATRNATLDAGYLWCDGAAIPTAHTALIAICGANTPDYRGRTFVGLDNMGGSDAGRLSVANTLGGTGGHEELQSHTHAWSEGGFTGIAVSNENNAGGAIGHYIRGSTNPLQSAGTGSGKNMPPYALCNVIIKY